MVFKGMKAYLMTFDMGSIENAPTETKAQFVILFSEIERLQHVNSDLYGELVRSRAQAGSGSGNE